MTGRLDADLCFRPASAGRPAFYRLHAVTTGSASESRRVGEARSRASQRLRRQRGMFRPLGVAVIAVVVIGTATAHPAPALHGRGLGVTLALLTFAGTLAYAVRDRFGALAPERQAIVIATIGAAGTALAPLQPHGVSQLAASAAVWMAVARLALRAGIALAAAVTISLAVAAALSGSSGATVLAATLLCALLGLMARAMQQARERQDQSELLLAQLEDAREQQTRAAALAERGRIASELHDVLAHSLSGAAIQLQGARLLAAREQATPAMQGAIDRASELVRDGLTDARQAVGALRGEELPGVDQLEALVEGFRRDLHVDATLRIEGRARPLAPEAGLALYRGVQEALTNVARYASGASTVVVLHYAADRTSLSVEDRQPVPAGAAAGAGLAGVGGGRGLAGMRERIERAGGSMRAGPTAQGWRVELDVPA